MKILYVAPRYHTNQVPIMKGWNECGVEVDFLAQYEGISEVHDYVQFFLMEPTKGSQRLFKKIEATNPPDVAESIKIKKFSPRLLDVYKKLKKSKPDIVVLREFSKVNAIVIIACRLAKIKKIVMYVQAPIYNFKQEMKVGKKLFRKCFFTSCTFTPVLYKGNERSENKIYSYPGSPRYFIPLVCDLDENEKKYSHDGIIRILDVGKYRDYKNHFFLVEAIRNLTNKNNIHVTIIGQVSNSSEREYFDRLHNTIINYNLEKYIELKSNVPFYEMENIYREHDVLILPSTNETAGMVILEAMASGLCVISSIHCGLASYLDKYKCGFTFDIDTTKELEMILTSLNENPSLVSEYGGKSKKVVREFFQFENYKAAFNKMILDYYGEEI